MGMFQWGMRQSAEVVNQMTGVERILEMSTIDQEPPLESPAGTLLLKIINFDFNKNTQA